MDDSSLNSIGERDRTDIRSASGTKLKVSGRVPLHVHMSELDTRDSLGAVRDFFGLLLLETACIDKFSKLIKQSWSKLVHYTSLQVPVLMVHAISSAAEQGKSDYGQDATDVLALSVKLSCKSKYIMLTLQDSC